MCAYFVFLFRRIFPLETGSVAQNPHDICARTVSYPGASLVCNCVEAPGGDGEAGCRYSPPPAPTTMCRGARQNPMEMDYRGGQGSCSGGGH